MTEPLQVGLIITVIGMGLVFAAIVLLWGLMALMVHIDALSEKKPVEPVNNPPEALPGEAIRGGKNLAAVAALAVAMALKNRSETNTIQQLQNLSSPWQQLQRAQAVQEKSRLFSFRLNRRS